jgi:hypothetical protein
MSVSHSQQSKAAVPVSATGESPQPAPPNSFDDLLRAVRELLIDPRLDVSVVTPLIYSLLETYLDRFQIYPFDEVSLLLNRLELDGYPAHALRELISRIEHAYEQNHGDAIHDSPQALAMGDEFEGLRQSIRYAAMMAEQEYRHDNADVVDLSQIRAWSSVRHDG